MGRKGEGGGAPQRPSSDAAAYLLRKSALLQLPGLEGDGARRELALARNGCVD